MAQSEPTGERASFQLRVSGPGTGRPWPPRSSTPGPDKQRAFLCHTVQGLTDEQAALRTTASELCLGGLINHVAQVEQGWADFIEHGPRANGYSLDISHPLPDAPWFEPGACWSARRVALHILAETAQHSGHADIIRESLDGAKTMG
jgi:hypothetical protein